MKPEQIVQRYERLQSDRKVIEQTWQAIELFIRPYSGKFFRDETSEASLEWRRRNIYDSTAVMASKTLAASLHGVLTSPAIQWFTMQYRDRQLQADHQATVWLEESSKKTFSALQDSNFNQEITSTYKDLTTYGTSFLVEETTTDPTEPWQGVDFAGVPIKEGYFEEDQYGQVKNFYRLLRWTASKLVDKFGLENVPDNVKKSYERAGDEKHEVIFCVWDREKNHDQSGVLKPSDRPFGYAYVYRNDKTRLGDEGGYYEMPVFAPRWETSSESRWGHSPATIALADVLTLNQLVELVLKAAEKVIDPAILTEERAMFSDLDLGAGKVNVVRNIDRIVPFESKTRMDVAQLRIEDLRQQINTYFHIDQLALKESPAMTATEVQVRYELMHRHLSGTMARLRNDLLNPLVDRTFKLLLRAGQLDPIPDAVAELGPTVDIEYVGPLARAQRGDQSAALERYILQLTSMAEIAPEVMMVPDWPAIARESALNLNIPAALLRPQEDVEADQEAMKQAQAQQAQAAVQGEQAQADKTQAEADSIESANPTLQ